MKATFNHPAPDRAHPRAAPGSRLPQLLVLLILLAFTGAGSARADAVLNECSEAALRSALGVGGLITVNCDGTLTVSNTLTIAHDAILDATGHRLTISSLAGTDATNATRLFFVNSGVHFSLINLTLTGGRATNGGAIYNYRGTLSLDGCVLSNNVAIGVNGRTGGRGRDSTYLGGADGRTGGNGQSAFGGAIYNFHGITFVNRCSILTNGASAGSGGTGGTGGNGYSQGGDGGNGGAGGKAQGGAIYNSGFLSISNTTFFLNTATAGAGGAGGTNGTGFSASDLGHGGGGAISGGGAIYNLAGGVLEIVKSTFTLNTAIAGSSASAGSDRNRARGGKNGGSSVGGAVANYGKGSVINSTFFANKSIAGSGGDGASSEIRGGSGGDGGAGWGGNIYNAKSTTVLNCTFFDGGASGGTNGLGGSALIAGHNGHRGASRGGNLANANGTFSLKNSIIAFPLPGTNGYGAFKDDGYNLSSDRSIRLKGVGSRTNTDPRIALLGRNGGPTETIPILDDSPAINAADPTSRTPTDQRGAPRPNGSRDDIGAYEYGLTLLPPVITSQPQSQIAQAGATVSFIVVVRGDSPLTYLWRRNGNAITDTAGPVLTLYNVQPGDAATNYNVVVSNNSGSITSTNAELTLINPVAISTQPIDMTIAQGGSTIFRVSATGDAPLSYQWFHDGVPIPGATLNSFSLSNIGTNQAGVYSVRISNPFSSLTSANATLTVSLVAPVIASQPESLTVLPDETATFTVQVLGSLPLQYDWFQNTTNPVGSFLLNSNRSTLIISNAQTSNAGNYHVIVRNLAGSTASEPATLMVAAFPPSITLQPTNLTVSQGHVATFRVTATGTAPLLYQWFFNGTNSIPGGTGPVLSIPNAGEANAGSYHVVVSNRFGVLPSDPATLTVTFSPPEITEQPENASVFTGEDATFTVVATGSLPLSYQWFHDDVEIPGATSPSLTLSNVSSGTDGGHYYVTIANPAGSTNSDTVTLLINEAPPELTSSPTNIAVMLGSNAIFTVVATNSRPFTYQWNFNDVAITNATNATLVITNVAATNAGDYTVTVSNGAGDFTSDPATLTVIWPSTPTHTDITVDPITSTITFQSEDGFDYVLELFNPESEEWDPLDSLTGDGTQMHFTDTQSPTDPPTTPLYRVTVAPTPAP